MDFNAIPTLGSVRERLGYFATITEEGELNTTLNNAYNCIYELEKETEQLRAKLKQWQALCDTYYAKLIFEPTNTFHFVTGYRYLKEGGK
jgi:hypothetical protein